MSDTGLRPRRGQLAGGRLAWGWVLALALLWTVLPSQALYAAPHAQTDVQVLGLGEYGVGSAAAGDTFAYAVSIPETGVYLVTAVDDADAANFDLVVSDDAGNILYDDVFTSVELSLDPGMVTLEFSATADADLLFVLAGEIGVMTADPNQPGRLYAGGAYAEELINDARYGTLTVPPTEAPRRVIVYVETGEADTFFVSVEGEDMGYISLDTASGNLLSFWSAGGDYEVIAEPLERRSSFSLAVFLSPAPPSLVPGDPFEGVIAAGTQDTLFEVVLDTPYDLLSIDLLDDADGLEIELVDTLYAPNYSAYSFGEPFIDAENVPPGTYYIRVYGDIQSADRAVTLTVEGEAGTPIATIALDEAATGILDAETTSVFYQVEIPEAGVLVAVAIASDTEDNDFDIEVGLQPGDALWYSFDSGSEDLITFVAPIAGTYYVGIQSNDTVGDYALAVSAGELAPAVPADGTPLLGSVDAYSTNLHRLDINEPNQIVTLILVGPPVGDLDVRLSGYDVNGQSTIMEYGLNGGSVEVVSEVAEQPGILEVVVNSYSDEPANYALIARVENPNRILALWAVDAAASSAYGETDYSPQQATGAPNTLEAGDRPTAWTPLDADGGEEYLEVAYEFPIVPTEINIHQSYNPGAIFAVEIYDLENEEWVSVWEGEPGPVDTDWAVLSIELSGVEFATDGVRIFLDTTSVSGWNEIDAVELRGRP
ncbi:MAG: PPC domain-containing protein [Litorilinea sp.]